MEVSPALPVGRPTRVASGVGMSPRPLNTVIIGAAGRMGRALIRAAAEVPTS